MATMTGKCEKIEYFGQDCDCARCLVIDGVCVNWQDGGGCAECEGPVHGCDPTEGANDPVPVIDAKEGNDKAIHS